jgi:hypothetical protein
MSERSIEISGRMVFGFVVLTLGVLFTLGNFNLIDAHAIVRWWPSVLIVVGLAKLFGIGTRRHLVWGIVFSMFGVLWLGDSLHAWNFDVWDLWPVFLIIMGGSLLSRGLRRDGAAAAGVGDPADTVRSFAMMSGVTRRVVSQTFIGGELSAVMGGIELDLRDAKFKDGRAVVDVFAMWGGIDLFVAESCRVSNEGLAIMGAIEDSSKPRADTAQTLVIRGFVLMGGVDIKNR